MGGADAVAVGDGGQPLHVGVEQHRQRRRLGFAKLRELRRNGLDGAVVLAELGAGGDGVNGGGVTLRREGAGQIACIGGDGRIEPRTQPLGELRSALASEFLDGSLAAVLGQEAEGAGSQVVISRRTGSMTRLGKGVLASRATPTALHLRRARAASADDAGSDHRVEVTPNSGRSEAEPLAELRCGGGTELHEKARHPVTRPRVSRVMYGRIRW
ncbi:MAG: hypothetical protein JWN96_2963 [Mycobacterium sp.]|nr:hypothetical protein [Mycobacterium sp.]